jgi:hypothetical protein
MVLQLQPIRLFQAPVELQQAVQLHLFRFPGWQATQPILSLFMRLTLLVTALHPALQIALQHQMLLAHKCLLLGAAVAEVEPKVAAARQAAAALAVLLPIHFFLHPE